MRYRFPILLAICISYLGFAPGEVRLAKLKITASELIIIQTLEANAQDTSPSPQQGSVYDLYMRTGYQATDKKDYQKALEAFKKAISERPQDSYAQKALSNVENYLAKANPKSKNNFNLFGTNSIWLIAGSGLLLLAILGALVSFLILFKKSSKQAKQNKDKYKNFSLENDSKSSFSSPFFENSDKDFKQNSEKDLPVQSPTRIPSLDLIEELIKTLRDPESKTRRKAIWKIAQVSDSRAMKPLVDLMIETDSYERSLILEALSQVCSRTIRPMNQALAISLQDKNSQVRKNAIRDLTRLYDLMSQINELLCYALDDENIEVQETAKWALDKLNVRKPIRLNIPNPNGEDDSMFEEDIAEQDESEQEDQDFFKR